MRESKLVRESLRILLQATSKCPCLFTDKFCRRVKRKWNLIQFEELQKIPHVSPVNRHDVVHADLTCTSGDGETVHPSVLYFPNGWGIGNWKYLMAVTPFPNGIVYFENPEFVVSNDGISWSLPSQNAPSPVVPPPSEWTGYNSDPICKIYSRRDFVEPADSSKSGQNAKHNRHSAFVAVCFEAG